MNHIDLFSGIGGFALAARWAGIETIAFCEKDEFCREVLKKHWPDVFIFDDIITMHHFSHVDLLTAGFPCQPFSVAGKRKGKDDDRYLWPETIRVIRECRPSWLILENVPGIIPSLDPILEDLEREGYTWRAYLISASSVGAPHKRERLWVIAYRDSERCNKWGNHRQKRSFFDDWQWNIETIQPEWSQFVPESWETLQAEGWLALNYHASRIDDGLPNRLDRLKSLGNSIVPQIPYIFMKAIQTLYVGLVK